MELRGKVAIVTGAAMGLGRAYAAALAGSGVRIAACDIEAGIGELTAHLPEAEILAWQGDVADPDHVRTVVDGCLEAYGRIDILVNNAGVWRDTRATDDLDKSLEDCEVVLGANLKGAYLFGRAVIPVMLRQGSGGDIVNVATDHMVTCGTPWHVCPQLDSCPWAGSPRPTGGGDTMDIYDAAKWGLNGLLHAWAPALAPHGVRVNQLCMGATDTHMIRSFYGNEPPDDQVATWMNVDEHARVLLELLAEGPGGRNAQSINFCVGRPVALEAPLPPRYVRAADVEVKPS